MIVPSIQFCLFQNHLNVFIYRLGIPRLAAWAMIRSKLETFFEGRQHLENIHRLRSFLFAEEVPSKAFMVMKLAENQIKYQYRMVANVLLEGIDEDSISTNGKLNGKSTVVGKTNGVNGHKVSNGH